MRRLIVFLVAVLGLVVWLSPSASLQQGQPGRFVEQRGGFDISGPYEADPNWPKKTWPAKGFIWGSQSGVYPESADRVFLASRGELELPKDARIGPDFPGNWGALNRGGATGQVPVFRNTILAIDRQGNMIESWTQWDYLFEGGRGPHQIYVQPYDPERHVWVVDDMNHVIHKFTNDGKTKVLTLGEMGVFGPNDDLQHFNRPTMIDWLPDGPSSSATAMPTAGWSSSARKASRCCGGARWRRRRKTVNSPFRTASPWATTGGSTCPIGSTARSRCSTKTAASSTSGPAATVIRCQ